MESRPVSGVGQEVSPFLDRALSPWVMQGLGSILIALFVVIVAVEAVLLVQIPDSSTLWIYQDPENRTLVKP